MTGDDGERERERKKERERERESWQAFLTLFIPPNES